LKLLKKLLNLLVDVGVNLSEPMPVKTLIQPVSRMIRRRVAVVLANKGLTVSAVAGLVGCGVSTVSRSLERIVNTGDIVDRPRSGRPATYSETFKLELIGFYCQTQPLPNSGRWTLRWAAAHLAKHP
jgi:transposase